MLFLSFVLLDASVQLVQVSGGASEVLSPQLAAEVMACSGAGAPLSLLTIDVNSRGAGTLADVVGGDAASRECLKPVVMAQDFPTSVERVMWSLEPVGAGAQPIGGLIGSSGSAMGLGGLGSRGGGTADGIGGLPPQEGQPPAPAEATLSLGAPVTKGSLSPAQVTAVVATEESKLRYCYQRRLTTMPDLRGQVVINFTVGTDGLVSGAKVLSTDLPEGVDVPLCMVGRYNRLVFPTASAPTAVTQTLTLGV